MREAGYGTSRKSRSVYTRSAHCGGAEVLITHSNRSHLSEGSLLKGDHQFEFGRPLELGPEAPDRGSFDLGPLVARSHRRLYLTRVEEVHSGGRPRNDEHALGTCRLQVLHLVVDVVRNAAQQRTLVPV